MLAGMLDLNGNVLNSLMMLELVLNLPQGFEWVLRCDVSAASIFA